MKNFKKYKKEFEELYIILNNGLDRKMKIKNIIEL